MPGLGSRSEISQAKAFQGDNFQPPRETLGGLAEQFGGGTAQNEEARGQRLAVREHAQQREEVGPALDFVNHHPALEGAEGGGGFGQPGQGFGLLEIEVVERIRRHEVSRQSRLAGLPGLQQRDDPAAPQGGAHQLQVGFPGDHAGRVHHENPAVNA